MIQRRKLKSGEVRYDVRLHRPDGTEYAKTFRTKRQAERYEAEQKAARTSGHWVDPTLGRMTFAAWADEWLAASRHTWAAQTQAKHESALRTHWLPRFGSARLETIGPRDVQVAINELAVSHSSSSVRTYFGTFRSLMKHAVDRDILARTPCRAIKLPADRSEIKRVASPGEIMALADAVGERWRCTILLAGVSGLRFGEVAGLRRSDVRFDRQEVNIARAMTETGGRLALAPPKSAAGVRVIPLPTPLVAELRDHIERFGRRSNELLFVNRHGDPMRRSVYRRRVFLPAVAQVGLDGLTFHGLRHSAATEWVSNGVDLRTVQAWLGHADPKLVLRLYAHISSDAGHRAAELVAGAFWAQ